jgi:uncharacterized membrane protein
LSLDILDIALIATGAAIGLIALVILKLRVENGKEEYKKYSSFLLMGGTWFIVGLTLGVFYRGTGVFDSPLLSLGLIFLFAGSIGVITEYLKHQKYQQIKT